MSLDFRHTCPEIDDCIETYKADNKELISIFVGQFLPSNLIDTSNWRYKDFISDLTCDFENIVLPLFEKIRSLNSEMRDQADKQIEELEEKISELQEVIVEYEKQSIL